MTRRYETAVLAVSRARAVIDAAESERLAVLAEWAASPGWNVASVAEHTGLGERAVTDAVRAAKRGSVSSRPGGTAATPPKGTLP
jgi:hypothetical protein